MNVRRHLDRRLTAALAEASGLNDAPAMIAPAARPEFGDYQANGVMAAAKRLKTNPRQLAEKVVAIAAAGDLADMVEPLEVAGPGFINIRLKPDWLAGRLLEAAADERLGIEPAPRPQTVVVDYSAPNLAKEMHVGHLRSTIIGDALARTLDALGHHVVRQNHVGDWGTQFGMLVAHMPRIADLADLRIPDLETYYVEAKKRFDSCSEFATKARKIVSDLHKTGPDAWRESDSVLRWRNLRQATLDHCYEVYGRLGVWFTPKEYRAKWQPHGPEQVPSEFAPAPQTGILGESFYNDYLPKVIEVLTAKGLLSESEGAQCVFIDEFKGKDGAPLPLIVQKSDEGYLYATTDLAAIWFRCGKGKEYKEVDWVADRILYVVDARQGLHFKMVFAVARKAGFAPPEVSLEHVAFGTMQGADGKPFKTRTGGTVKLMDLLDEAERRAYELVKAKSAERDDRLGEDTLRDIARVVGIGAVKYADLSQNRTSDYVFSFDKMLSLDGNTAPYMQYAYARIKSILRKRSEIEDLKSDISNLKSDISNLKSEISNPSFALSAPEERRLAVRLCQFPETVQTVADECLPNVLCAYLYDLSSAFTAFYEACPVLKSDEPVRSSRLALCELTARAIRCGLELLGIETVEQM